ncbi:MAG: hypothetical protein KGL39_24380 [Patescibacteria group bacterium]|nr:hypothetical protein [Patescibacteria group bacterium]
MSRLFQIPPEMLDLALAHVGPMIDSAAEYSVGKYKGADVVDAIRKEKMQLWVVIDDKKKIQAIAITELALFPQAKVCRFLCATGENAPEWIHLIKEIEDWAVNEGCTQFQAECRPGWERLLKSYDYQKTHVILNKEIGDAN